MKPSLDRLIELQRLLTAFSAVERTIHRDHHGTFVQENDTEHSYNLAMTAWFLSPHFPNLNPQHLIRYGLVHDLVEVHAGDTYIYGTDADIASKQAREEKALKKLQIDWYDFPELTTDIQAYEARNSAEAKFIYALDKIMPIMLAYIHNGYSWDQAKVTVDMLYKAKIDKVGVSPEILPYFLELHTLLLDHPELIKVR